tara:strand:+ start:2380 stop:3261 length:882 start_codon:yes stop_codon:yes gene_type:complete
MRKQNIHFITYGDSKYFVQRHHLKSTAKASKFFDSSKAYSPKDLDSDFKQKFSTILKEKKGAGFWIWKHHIIEKELDRLNYNDLLVWSDAGSSFNYFAKEKFDEYVELLNTSSSNNLRFKMKHIENEWTSKELFNYFGIDPFSEIGKSGQYHATHMIFKKNKELSEYFDIYKELLNKDKLLITDFYENNQIDGFNENRHDQSIFSLLSKTLGCVEIQVDETCSSEILEKQTDYPFLSTRTKYTLYKKIKFILLYFYYKSKPVYFNDKRFWFQRPSIFERIVFKFNNLKNQTLL